MSAPDPEGMTMLGKIAVAAVAAFTPVAAGWRWIESRFDKKADKDFVTGEFQKVHDELKIQRGHVGKIFDQIRESEQRAADRFERLMDRIAGR